MLGWAAAPRSTVKALILVTAILSPCCAHADDDYPSRPVKIITPFGAGGPTDVYTRAIAASGADLATTSVPIVVPAPGRSSIMKGWRKEFRNSSPSTKLCTPTSHIN